MQVATVAAVAAVAGALVAVTARDRRAVALGLLVALAAAPLAAITPPGAPSLVARLAGAMLAADLLWVATRVTSTPIEGSAFGLTAQAAIAGAAFVVGMSIAPVNPLPGPVSEQAAGLSMVALSLVPLTGRDVLRLGTGVAVLALGLSMLHEVWLEPARPFEQFALASLIVGIAGATSLLLSRPPELVEDTGVDNAGDGGTTVEPTAVEGALAGAGSPATAAAVVAGEAKPAPAGTARSARRSSAGPAPAIDAPPTSPQASPQPPSRTGPTVRLVRHPRGNEPRQ